MIPHIRAYLVKLKSQQVVIRLLCVSNKNCSDIKKLCPYVLLGITNKTATAIEIKKAYIQLASQHHPDLSSNSTDSASTFKLLSSAYYTLSSPDRRTSYDNGTLTETNHQSASATPNQAPIDAIETFNSAWQDANILREAWETHWQDVQRELGAVIQAIREGNWAPAKQAVRTHAGTV